MNLIKRLWQWYSERRVEHQALKGKDFGGHARPQGATPIVGIAEDARLRLLIRGRRR